MEDQRESGSNGLQSIISGRGEREPLYRQPQSIIPASLTNSSRGPERLTQAHRGPQRPAVPQRPAEGRGTAEKYLPTFEQG